MIVFFVNWSFIIEKSCCVCSHVIKEFLRKFVTFLLRKFFFSSLNVRDVLYNICRFDVELKS